MASRKPAEVTVIESATRSPGEELVELRRAARDLVALAALPELLLRADAGRIADTLADVLFGMLRCDLGFVRVVDADGGDIDAARCGWRPGMDSIGSRELQVLEPYLGGTRNAVDVGPHPEGNGELRLRVFPIGAQGGMGMVAAAAARTDFPTRIDETILAVAANQAAVGLERDRTLRHAKHELERRVARRTAALRESGERMRQLAENITEVFWVVECRDQRISFVNHAYETVFGRSCASLYADARSYLEAVHPDDRALATAAFERQLQGNAIDVTYRVAKPNGETRWVRDRAFPIRDSGGDLYRSVGIAEDITGAVTAMQALQESERRFATAFHASPMVQAINRVSDYCFVDVNDTLLNLFGLRREATIGRTSTQVGLVLNPDQQEQVRATLQSRMPVRGREVRVITPLGRALDMLMFSEPIEVAGERCVLTTAYEITERKRAREQLDASFRQLRELTESLMRAQDEERRRIARQLHETTAQDLAALKMTLAALHRQLAPRERASAELLTDAMDLADRCMREIRTVSYVLHPPFLDEAGLGSALRWYVRGFVSRSGIDVSLDLPHDLKRLPQEVETTLFRIVQESLTNIYRHADSPTAVIRLRRRARTLVLEIVDRGRGMSGRGTGAQPAPFGVGTASMQERTRQLGGRLKITCTRLGTTVTAILPLPPEGDRAHPANPDR